MNKNRVMGLLGVISLLLVALIISACSSTGQGSATATGSLYVTSTPSAAGLYIDNVYKGMTPRLVSYLTAGSHSVRITKTGYSPYSTTVNIQSGQRANLAATLTLVPAPTPSNQTNTTTPPSNQTNGTAAPIPTNATNQTAPTCTNECNTGQLSCSGTYARSCGNYDADACLEWNAGSYCAYGCVNGLCQSAPAPSNQTNGTQPTNQTNTTG